MRWVVCLALLLVTSTAFATPEKAKAELLKQHGETHRARIERGVDQVAALWRKDDGDLVAFARTHFIADQAQLDATFARFESVLEQVEGHFYEITREVRRASDLEIGPLLPVDELFGGFEA